MNWTPDQIKDLRQRRRETQAEFGLQIYDTSKGTAQRLVSDLERGKMKPGSAARKSLWRLSKIETFAKETDLVYLPEIDLSEVDIPEGISEEEAKPLGFISSRDTFYEDVERQIGPVAAKFGESKLHYLGPTGNSKSRFAERGSYRGIRVIAQWYSVWGWLMRGRDIDELGDASIHSDILR
jgi:transcriptional regulator with XRE-family HTH domain